MVEKLDAERASHPRLNLGGTDFMRSRIFLLT